MWRSSVSHGAIVPSVADLEVRERALDAGLRPVGMRRADVALDLARWRPASRRRGERLAAGLPAGERRRTARASHRRRTRSRARAPGARRASSRTTLPPHDWPATTGRSSPSCGSPCHVVRHGRHVVRAVGLGGAAVAAEVDRRPRDGRASLSVAATPSHIRAFDARPWTSTNGTAPAARRRGLPRVDGQLHAGGDGDALRVHRMSIAEAAPQHGGARTASALVVRERQPEAERCAAARRSCRPRSRNPSPPGAGS